MNISITLQGTLTRKGQVTVPVDVRKALGLQKGDMVAFILAKNKKVEIFKKRSVVAQTAGALRSIKPILTAKQLRQQAEQAIAEEAIQRSR